MSSNSNIAGNDKGGAAAGLRSEPDAADGARGAETRAASLADFKPETREVPCDFCGGRDFVPFADKMRHGLHLNTVLCKTCALAQTNPQPTAESLATFYGQYYHLFHQRRGVDDSYVAKSRRMAERRFRLLRRFLDPARATPVLEVGPGAGSFLEKCRDEAAWRAVGVEPGAESHAWCVGRGLTVEHARFEDYESAERFGLIAAFNVVDHLCSPRAFLEKCHALLADDGLLVLEVVNFDRPSLPRDQFLQFPLLYIFSFISLVNLLAATGFRPVFHDETSSDTSVGTMTVIARRMSQRWEKDFIQVDLERYKKNLDRKDRIYRLAERLPRFSIFGRLRSVLKSV